MNDTIRAYPKVNLTLDILGRDKNGHHYVDTILCEVRGGMFDEITIGEVDNVDAHIEISCDNDEIPLDKANTAWHAVDIMSRQYAVQDKRIHIHIKKGIPVESGLGGASADAAAVMKFLNTHWNLNLSEDQMRARAAEIGVDTPFFITGGIARATGFGEKIEQLNIPRETLTALAENIVIVDTGIRIGTGDAYRNLDLAQCGKHTDKTASLIRALKTGDTKTLAKYCHNDFYIAGNLPFKLQNALRAPRFADSQLRLSGSGGCAFQIKS